MLKQILRDVLADAQKLGQTGLIVWSNRNNYNSWSSTFKQGNEYFDFVLSQVEKGERTPITFHWEGFTGPPIIAASVEKLTSSDKSFSNFLNACRIHSKEGPITITFVPSNELSQLC